MSYQIIVFKRRKLRFLLRNYFSDYLKFCAIFFVAILTQTLCFSQELSENQKNHQDIKDVWQGWFKKNNTQLKKVSNSSFLPFVGYNPSTGFLAGASIVTSKYFGNNKTNALSTLLLNSSISTFGVFIAQFKHNIFLKNNEWNLQGVVSLSNSYLIDYGLGSLAETKSRGIVLNSLPVLNGDSVFPIRFKYQRFFEKVFLKIGKNLYAGVGLSFDLRKRIDDSKLSTNQLTPHFLYSLRNGFDLNAYNMNGFLFNFQYNGKEHTNRSYSGWYVELNFRNNVTWLGSSKNTTQLFTDVKKYFSLSKKNPEHVLALWFWANYKLSGTLGYLELPGTSGDVYGRSGRGYTAARFKGPDYMYFETEYRFPISTNTKLLSGVFFANFQTASDDLKFKLLDRIEPAAGAGLRILFNKHTRSNLCIDFAVGRYGSHGVYFNLNEAF